MVLEERLINFSYREAVDRCVSDDSLKYKSKLSIVVYVPGRRITRKDLASKSGFYLKSNRASNLRPFGSFEVKCISALTA